MLKTRNKFIIALAACLALCALALVGCSSGGDASGSGATTPGTYEQATVEDVQAALADGSAVVLDARTQDAYAGWSTERNAMGGHIDGAKGFSANWLTCTYDDEGNNDAVTREDRLVMAMGDKGITTDTPVIVYDENGQDAQAVADYLASQGVSDIKLFNLADWSDALSSYPAYDMYVPADVVKNLIDGVEVPEIGKVDDLKIVEFSWGSVEESGYLDGHVPGAVHINSDDIDDEENMYILDPDKVLVDTVTAAGISADSTVVVCGDGLFACHLATVLKYLGVENVYVMSGGASAWSDAGYELETDEVKPEPVKDFGVKVPANPTFIDSTETIDSKLKAGDSDFQVIDTRTMPEFLGETSGYTYVPEAGRPDGCIFGQGDGSKQNENSNASSMIYYENIDGSMRDAAEIEQMWIDSGIDPSKHMSFFCGGGYRAAEVMWDAIVMGYDDASLYNDGWSGWVVKKLPAVQG